jgi:tetratricopeptide (TPR) repeat protein
MSILLTTLLLLVGCGGSLRHITPPALPEAAARQERSPPAKSLQHYALGVISWQEGELEQAQEHLGIALLFDPNAAWLHLARGQLAIERGELEQARESLTRAVNLAPGEPRPRLELALVLEVQGEYEAAIRQLETLLEHQRVDRAFHDLVHLQLMAGRPGEAEAVMDRWVQAEPANDDDLRQRAALLIQLGRHAEAWHDLAQLIEAGDAGGPLLDLLMEAMKRSRMLGPSIDLLTRLTVWEPGNEEVLVRLAGLASAAGDPFLAVEAWSRLDLLQGGHDADVKEMLAQATLEAGEPERALEIAAQAAALDPEIPLLVHTRSRALAALGRLDEALAQLEERPGWEQDSRTQRLRAELLLDEGRPDEAREALEAAMLLSPDSWIIAHELAAIEARSGQLERALARAEAQPDPLAAEPEWALTLARLEVLAGERDRAVERALSAEQRWPLAPSLPLARSGWLEEAGQGEEAWQALRAARERMPSDPAINQQLARLSLARGDGDSARALLRGALEANPDDPLLLNDLAYLETEAGVTSDDVLAMARRAVEQRPASAAFLDTLGWALWKRGEVEEARRTLERALRFAPDDTVIREHLDIAKAGPRASSVETR